VEPIVAFGENLPLVPIGSPKGSQSHSHTYEDTLAMTMDTKKQPFNTDDNTYAETDPEASASGTEVAASDSTSDSASASASVSTDVLPPTVPFTKSIENNININKSCVSVPAELKCERLISGHSQGELWGLCAHPTQPYFYTAGDDCTVRCWSLNTQSLVSYIKTPDKTRCLSATPDGRSLAVGFNSGHVWIVPTYAFFSTGDNNSNGNTNMQNNSNGSDDPASLVVNMYSGEEIPKPADTIQLKQRSGWRWLQEIKYSFDGSLLAVGSHDNSIYLYDVNNNYEFIVSLKGHADFISHIDFGVLLRKSKDVIENYDNNTKCIIVSTNNIDSGTGKSDVPATPVPKKEKTATVLEKVAEGADDDNKEVDVAVSESEVDGPAASSTEPVATTTAPVDDDDNASAFSHIKTGPRKLRTKDIVRCIFLYMLLCL